MQEDFIYVVLVDMFFPLVAFVKAHFLFIEEFWLKIVVFLREYGIPIIFDLEYLSF